MELSDIYQMLDENNSLEIQKKGMELAKEYKEIDKFILPIFQNNSKNVWLNCARIISERTDEELLPYLSEILEWLQDLNWPGTFIIIDRLMNFDGRLLVKPYLEAIHLAYDKNMENMDEQEWATYLSVLIKNQELVNNLSDEDLSELQKLYHNFWSNVL